MCKTQGIFFKVCVRSITFNHASFIEDAMNGFCMQKTTFPFICVIIDDASTDGEDLIIKKYIEENFDVNNLNLCINEETDDYSLIFAQHKLNKNCYFAIYLLKYNHHRIKKSRGGYYERWDNGSQYIAICEGDDYWISPDKLQRQVSFLDSHQSYSMACNRTFLFSVKKNKVVGESYCYSKNRRIRIKDVIYRTGLFISSCSIVYRKEISANRPDYWKKCLVGDSPLQIACVMKGYAWYFNDAMSVYRIDNPSSWMGNQDWGNRGADPRRLEIIKSQVKMFEGFGKDFPVYHHLFDNKIAEQINNSIPLRRVSSDKVSAYLSNFQKEISQYNLRWRIDLLCRKSRLPFIRGIYQILFTRRFLVRNKWYKV